MTRKITGQLTLILTIFTCTFFYYRDFGSRMLYGYSLIGILLALHLWDRLRRDEPLRQTPVTLSAALLALMILLQFLRPDAHRDEDTIAYFISMMICMAYVFIAPGEHSGVRMASKVIYLSAMAMAAFVVVFTFLPALYLRLVYPVLSETAQSYYDYFWPLGYGVSLGGYSYSDYVLFLGMAVCCADLALRPRTSRRIAGNGLSLAFLLLAMVALGRRGELLAAAVAIGLLVLAMCTPRRRNMLLLGGTLALVAGLALVIVFLPQLKQVSFLYRYIETLENLLQGQDITSGRLALYQRALEGFLEHPFFGIGWDQYYSLVPESHLGNPVVIIEDAHCIYLQFLCETGITGTVMLLLPILYLLVTTCRMLKAAKAMDDKSPLRFVCVSFLLQIFLMTLGFYDPSFQKLVFWCFYALALMFLNGAIIRSGWRPEGPVSRCLDRLARALAPAGNRLWHILRTPWKEGHR